MKELVILRHAKSNNKYLVDDIDRPLSTTGIERIKKISKKMLIFFKNSDIILSSPANRALHTAQLMMRELNYNYDQTSGSYFKTVPCQIHNLAFQDRENM